jgi:hypothetical protein
MGYLRSGKWIRDEKVVCEFVFHDSISNKLFLFQFITTDKEKGSRREGRCRRYDVRCDFFSRCLFSTE